MCNRLNYHPPRRRGDACGRICLSVNALTFESVDQESSFWFASAHSESLGQVLISMLLSQGQGHRSKKASNLIPLPPSVID